jgi:hypothetical protein
MLQERISYVKYASIPCCPICGGALKDEASWDAMTGTFSANGLAVKLTPRQASIFNPIWESRNRGGIVGQVRLAELAFANEVNGGPESLNVLSVYMAHIRKKIAVTGYTITKSYGTAFHAYRIIRIGEVMP